MTNNEKSKIKKKKLEKISKDFKELNPSHHGIEFHPFQFQQLP